MRRSTILASIAAGMLMASYVTADAQQRVQVGVLECRGGASVGFIVGSVTNLGCVLRGDGMPEDRYVAVIQKVGLDIGITEETALAWNVFAPVTRLAPAIMATLFVNPKFISLSVYRRTGEHSTETASCGRGSEADC